MKQIELHTLVQCWSTMMSSKIDGGLHLSDRWEWQNRHHHQHLLRKYIYENFGGFVRGLSYLKSFRKLLSKIISNVTWLCNNIVTTI